MFEKTYFVLAPSFHGATLLAKLLNAHPEVTTLGDTYPSNAFDQTCGCGEPVSRCPFWQAIKADTGAEKYEAHTRLMLPVYPGEKGSMAGRIAYSDFLSFWATPGTLRRWRRKATLAEFRSGFQAFTDAVHRHTPQPGRVFVDGLKYVSRYEAPWRRAPRSMASSMRNTGRGGWAGIVEHALRYRLYHARTRQASRHAKASITLSYEGLADDIDRELERLFHFMGNASLFDFDGVIRRSRHRLPHPQERLTRAIAGTGV